MAELSLKLPDNAPGRFYVDETCIDCELCRELAPAHFTRNDTGRYSIVSHQPRTPDEETACRAALVECPVEAIGDDGDQPG